MAQAVSEGAVQPARGHMRQPGAAIAYLLLATALTTVLATTQGLRTAEALATAFAFNLLVSVSIGASIDLGQGLANRTLDLDARRPWIRLTVRALVISASVLVGVEISISALAWFAPRFAGAFPRVAVLVVAIPVTVVMVSIERERERLRVRAALAEHDAEVLARTALRAELTALQNRTNPHFLFNALNTIAALIAEQPGLAERAVERLAEVLRFALEAGKRTAVTLGDELAVTTAYLELERLRFGPRLVFRIDAEPAAAALLVPPMSLQPLAENAVVHGVATRRAPTTVEIWARVRDDVLEIGVRNDGDVAATDRPGNQTAHVDLAQRLALLHGAAASLCAGRRESGGYEVVMRLPRSTP